jgi:hypothetical protein
LHRDLHPESLYRDFLLTSNAVVIIENAEWQNLLKIERSTFPNREYNRMGLEKLIDATVTIKYVLF